MNSFLHHKFYTAHRTGLKTVATIMYVKTLLTDLYRVDLFNGQHKENFLLCQTITKELAWINLKLC